MSNIVKYSQTDLEMLPEEFYSMKDFIIELTNEKVVFKVPAGMTRLKARTMFTHFKEVSLDLNMDRATGQYNTDYEVFHCYFKTKQYSPLTLINKTDRNKFIDGE